MTIPVDRDELRVGAMRDGPSEAGRFVDNGDGTVTDMTTGLVWMKDLTGLNRETWKEAQETCAVLGVAGGGWRLPTVKELLSLIDYDNLNPALPKGHPFSGVQLGSYWSSTTGANGPLYAWYVDLYYGYVGNDYKSYTLYVWPVRGGVK